MFTALWTVLRNHIYPCIYSLDILWTNEFKSRSLSSQVLSKMGDLLRGASVEILKLSLMQRNLSTSTVGTIFKFVEM